MGGDEPTRLRAGDVYSSWKRAIRVWQIGTSVGAAKQGARVIQALEGKTLDFATRMDLEKVKAATGVDFVLTELDKYFKKDETQIAFVAIENLENYKRTNESISEYIEEFSRRKDLVEECEGMGAAYSDSVLAYRLLKQAQLTPSESQLIRATIARLTFEHMVNAMKKTLGDVVIMEGAGASNNSAVLPIGVIKREFDEGAQFYGNSNDYHKPWKNNWVKRGYNAYAGRGRNASGERGRGRSEYRPQNFNNDGTSAEDGRPDDQENKKDRHGNVMTCNICKSKFHFANICPER
jgi:hypothetical protein